MIPVFRKNGLLPIGIHQVSIAEFESRFVYNGKRRKIFRGFEKLIVDLKSIGCSVVYVDGSYVTAKKWPKDIDVCWDFLLGGEFLVSAMKLHPVLFETDFPRKKQNALYCADVFPTVYLGFDYLSWLQQDENGVPKGIIKLMI